MSFCLSNRSAQVQRVGVQAMRVRHIWDYAVTDVMMIVGDTLIVEPGEKQWVTWTLPGGIDFPSEGYVRFDLLENENVLWHVAGAIEPGHVSAFEMAPGKMRRYSSGVTLALRVEPGQHCFAASNVISGETRPHRGTNLWRSDPTASLPQSLTFSWETPQTISEVDLTFSGHLLREYHAYAPFYRDPQCVKDYDLQIEIGDKWETLMEVRGNYQRHRRHILDQPVMAKKVRVVVLATNGDPSAAIYEIRIY